MDLVPGLAPARARGGVNGGGFGPSCSRAVGREEERQASSEQLGDLGRPQDGWFRIDSPPCPFAYLSEPKPSYHCP